MFLTVSLALLAQTPQSPIAPPATTRLPRASAASQATTQQGSPVLQPGESAGDSLLGTASIESFETPLVAPNGTLSTTGPVLDETSLLTDGQGPGMVLGGCSYTSAGGQFQFHGTGYFGQPSQTITGYPSATVTIDYDFPQGSVGVALNAFDGYPDTADVLAYDAAGNVVDSVTGISLPDGATQVPVILSGVGIVKVDITSTVNYGWSPLIDDHNYSPTAMDAFELFEGATISVGSAVMTGLTALDDNSILANGDGPGLVQDGCTYLGPGGLQWNGDDYYGQISKTLFSTGGSLTMEYDYLQNGVSFTLSAFEGYGDTVSVTAYDGLGGVLQTISSISLPNHAARVPVELTANGIARVVVSGGTTWGWSGLIDNHDYDDAPPSIDQFETFGIAANGAINIGISDLDANTVVMGQGPGLVAPGVTYSAGAGGSIQWNNRGWSGQTSKNIIASSTTGKLEVRYDSIQSRVNFTLAAFDGYPDTASCTAYDARGNVVDTVNGLAVNDPEPVPVTMSSPAGIARIEVTGTQGWSPLFDHSGFTGSDYALDMSISGPSPGVQTVTVTGGRPGAPCKLLYSAKIGGSVISFGSCTGTPTELAGNLKLLNPLFFYDANGEVSASNYTPPGACGKIFIQWIDVDCKLSNVISL